MSKSSSPARTAAVPARLGWRLLALVYDAVIALALVLVISALALAVKPDHRPVQPGSIAAAVEFLLLWATLGAYAVVSWRRGGQTIGMKPWRLKVLTVDGLQVPWRQLLLRYSVVSLSLGTVLLWCLFDAERRGVHDIVSGTLLVRLQPTPVSPDSPSTG
jgi:uncharacterized RDD family membrane protein YckC